MSIEVCQHKSAVMLGYSRVTRVKNRQRSRMYVVECLRCGRLPMGPANDRGASRDIRLAKKIADLCILWEPSTSRTRWMDALVEIAAGQWSAP